MGTSIFATMAKMAHDHQALNLSQGFPDFPVSERLIQLVNENMKSGHNQYAPMPGLPALRNILSQMIDKSYGFRADPDDQITITSGATEALFISIMAIVQDQDEVIIFDPAYDSYAPVVELAGGIPRHLTLKLPDYHIDWEEVEDAISKKTKLLIINTPHNPSGAVLSADDMQTLQRLVEKYGLYVISDEVYHRIIFDDLAHESILRYPGLAEKAVAVFSFGKTFHATGWKVGYAVAPPEITTAIRKIHQFVTFSINTPVQHALATYLEDENHYTGLGKFYQQKRDYFVDKVKGSKFDILPCKGTYFQLLSYKSISDKSEMDMAAYLTKEYGIASIPTSPFYQKETNNQVLRFCFAKSEKTLDKAGEILCKI